MMTKKQFVYPFSKGDGKNKTLWEEKGPISAR